MLTVSYFSPTKITDHNISAALRQAAKAYAAGSLVDLGCGAKPYEEIFRPYVESYLGVDHPGTAALNYGDATKADVFADCIDTKLESERFDTLLSTQVIEHIYETDRYIAECRRILKKGGFGIFTIPFMWQCHSEPYDFYRFTKFGIEKKFREQSFEIMELRPLEGAFAALIQMEIASLYLAPSNIMARIIRKLLNPIVLPALNFIALRMDKTIHNDKLCLNYLLVVKKT